MASIKGRIEKVFLKYQTENNRVPASEVLQKLIKAEFKQGKQQKWTFLSYYADFVNRSFSGNKIDPKTGKSVGKAICKKYQTTLEHLKRFDQFWHRNLDFDAIDLEFHKDYLEYLSAKKLSQNTQGDHIKCIKAVLGEATERKINDNLTWYLKLNTLPNPRNSQIAFI